ncbi:MAG: outer membrane protein assembly factor BamD [Imperialibacter sp.]|jgi:outer membrane protein assembly factor BamD|uniref:outer membrane protein assembly factor BamD n=1 Tax=Imperialibacter sp. TaxID=2038411 RepID=UPI0032EDB9AF
MFKTRLLVTLLYLSIGFITVSCSEFRKIQKSTDWKRKYDAAMKYYEEEEYYKANVLFEDIIPIIKGTKEAELAEYYYAYSYYYQKQYILSSHYFKTFATTYARSEHAMEAQYMNAYSLYLESPVTDLDQSSTYEAIASMQTFINKYPYSEYKDKSQQIIDDLQLKLEKKSFDNARLYYQLRRYKSAVVAFNNFEVDFPDSEFNEEGSFLRIKCQFEYAQQSIPSKQEERYREAIVYYQKFIDKFPEGKFVRQAQDMYTISLEQVRELASISSN